MLGTKTSTVSAFLIFTASLVAQTPNYLPLHTGNSWLYKSEGRLGKDARSIEVTGTEKVGEQTYYLVTAFGRTALLRRTDAGDVVEFNRAAGSEQPWISFAGEEKASFPTAIEQCVKAARIEARSETLGSFENAVHIVFEPSCADAGLTDAWFVAEVGIVRYITTTIAGPRVYDLILSSVSTELALDAPLYRIPSGGSADLVGRLSLRNTSDQAITLDFNSGQRFDLAIKTAAGEVVTTWSAGKLFTQEAGKEVIPAGGVKNWVIPVVLQNLSPGRYTAEAWLTAANAPKKAYAASVAFDVAGDQPIPRIELSSYRIPRDVHLSARFSVQNRSSEPVVLEFPTGQSFDLAVEDPSGRVLLKWSDDKAFTQVFGTATIPPGGELSWTITQPVVALAPGKYVAEAWVTSSDPAARTFSAKAAFEVIE